jgi:DNA-binding transcriptional MerR regulator
MEKTNALFTRGEAAAALGVKSRTVYSFEKKGLLTPVSHVNGRPRYSVESLEAVFTKNKSNTSNG